LRLAGVLARPVGAVACEASSYKVRAL